MVLLLVRDYWSLHCPIHLFVYVEPPIVRKYNKLVANNMSSLMHCFAAIAGSIRGEKNGYYKPPPPSKDILVKFIFELCMYII